MESAKVLAVYRANNIAPHDTGCDLDHYTSIVALCGADASAAGAQMTEDILPKTTDTGCECMDPWYFNGVRYAGCQATPSAFSQHHPRAPWCVVKNGCTSAHPGPWGAWDYCKGATNCRFAVQWTAMIAINPTARAAAKRHCSLTSSSGELCILFYKHVKHQSHNTQPTVESTSVSGNAPFRKSSCKHLPNRQQKFHRTRRSP